METTPRTQASIASDDEATINSTEIDTAVNVTLPPESSHVRLSKDVVEFLKTRQETPHEVLSRPVVGPPEVDDSLPFSHYFISTSHNTYLLSYQLMGTASASTYTRVLSHHCRCVEIDVWTSANGPIVTHGYTWSDHIPFREVCVAIGDAVGPLDWPVMVSLECHLKVQNQDEIVKIMKEVWGEKLVDKEAEGFEGKEREVTPAHFKGRIVAMIEYYPPQPSSVDAEEESSSSGSESSRSKAAQKGEQRIGPSLAALGIYCRSVKPRSGWLTHGLTEPPHTLYNLSEGALEKLIPSFLQPLVTNSLDYMRRVYPKGSRVTSANLVPLKHWRSGTQIAALNWQRYDRGLQFNEAMFVGSGGWVLKPDRLRGVKPFEQRRSVRLTCEIIAGCNIPNPGHAIKAYIYVELFLSSCEKTWQSRARHSTSPTDPLHADLLWNEKCHWEYVEDDLAFVRLSVYQEEWGKDDRLGTFCARVDRLQPGWRFVRLFDKKGKHNGGLLLVKFVYV